MTTAATSLLGLALPVTGELSGTWGDTVNNSITSLLDTAIAGTTTLSTDGDVTLSTTTLAANQARQAILLCSGARTAIRTITAPAQSKIYTIINATTGGYAVKLVGVGPTTGLTIPNGASAVVAWNGSDFIEIGSSTIGNLTVNGNLTVTGTTTLSGGTANGVAYLNGSKVVTTGTALTFDGSKVAIATAGNDQLTWSAAGKTGYLYIDSAGVGIGDTALLSGNNTYYNKTSNYIAQYINGSEQMRLTSTGLGIGTSSPSDVLTLAGGASGSYGLTINNSKVGGGTKAIFQYDATNAIALVGGNTTNGLAFQTLTSGSLTTKATIDSSGNLGLGAASIANYRMYIESAGATSGTYAMLMRNSSLTTLFSVRSDGTIVGGNNAMTLSASGNLLVGLTSPLLSSRLEVKSSNNTLAGFIGGDAYGTSYFVSTNGSGQVNHYATWANSAVNAYHAWWVTASSGVQTQAMTLDASGNLGVGTTSPSARIHLKQSGANVNGLYVEGSANDSQVRIYNNGTVSGISSTYGSTGSYMPLVFLTSDTERARIDSSGNLGIGTTSQNERLRVNSSTAGQARLTVAYADSVISYFGSYSGIVGSGNATDVMLSSANVLAFGSGGTTERARIDSSGRLLVGQTSYSTTTDGVALQASGSVFARSGTGAATNINIANGNGVVGTITTSGTSTAYNTSSDYRLKESIAPMTGALAKVAALKPVTYKWKSDGSDGEGFIAHELAEVVPQCVTGEKDAVDAEGNPQYQGIDTSFLVATLTAALQEAVAEINSLKARLDAANL